jgi:hypothetical protein
MSVNPCKLDLCMPAILYSCFEGMQCANCDTPRASHFKIRQHCAEVLTALVRLCLALQGALSCIQSVNCCTDLVDAACMGFMSGMTSLQRRAATSGNFVTNTLEGIHDDIFEAHKHVNNLRPASYKALCSDKSVYS